jgi:hypothetical protein
LRSSLFGRRALGLPAGSTVKYGEPADLVYKPRNAEPHRGGEFTGRGWTLG